MNNFLPFVSIHAPDCADLNTFFLGQIPLPPFTPSRFHPFYSQPLMLEFSQGCQSSHRHLTMPFINGHETLKLFTYSELFRA